ncbi:MAG TPA: YbfB/YjiJ family MFS transporter [Noviherbaspirillum sp.]|nr:YbfB/YjiJ family MFS transporter [Noviherbaspirillum sp.]
MRDDDYLRTSTSPWLKAGAGLAALAVAMGIGRFAFTPVLPMMLQDGSISIAQGSLLASSNYLGYLIGALSAVALRIRLDRAIRGGLLVIGLATLAMGAPLGLGAWLLLRLVAGIASAWVLISISAWSFEALAGYRRPVLNSIVFAGVGTGIALAGLLCLALMAGQAGAARAWDTLGALALAATAAIWRAFAAPAASAPAAAAASAPAPDRRWNAASLRLTACYGAFGFGYIIPATFLPVMAKNALHHSPLFGWSWPLFGLAAAISTLAVAPLVRRLGNRRLWLASQCVMAAGVAMPALWPHIVTVFAAALCVGGTFMVITLAAMAEAKRLAGARGTVLMAAMTSAFAAGQIVGPLTVSGDRFSGALLLAAAVLALGALLLRAGGEPKTRV